jgi:multidrug efflux pump subunit AcrB
MPIDLFPNINQPVITIGTAYTGANVQDIEKTVTYPIEKAVSAVANVRHVEIINTLPSGVKQPFIVRFDLSNIPVCLITVSGGGLDERQLYDLAFNTIEPQLERLPGVASANVDGGKIRQIAVNLNRDLIEDIIRAHVRPDELKTIVSTVGIPAGRSAIFTANTGPHAAQVQVYLDTRRAVRATTRSSA